MALHARLVTEHPQTVQEMQLALDCRYEDAWALSLCENRHTGAIYLLGYVAEMSLKVAYFLAARGADACLAPWRKLAEYASSHAAELRERGAELAEVDAESLSGFHDLDYWRVLLVDVQRQQGISWSADFIAEWRSAIAVVKDNWCVGLRYASEFATYTDFETVDRGAAWLRANRVRLWRGDNDAGAITTR